MGNNRVGTGGRVRSDAKLRAAGGAKDPRRGIAGQQDRRVRNDLS